MPGIKIGSRRYVALAFAAALAGAAVSSPAPAAARTQQQDAEFACDPNIQLCNIQFLYYDSPALTTQVGFADDDCGAGYVLHWGEETDYVKVRYLHCPI